MSSAEGMPPRNKLGVVGGMGSVAAASVFRILVDMQDAVSDQDYIEVFLHNNSRVPDRTESIVGDGESPLPEIKRSVEVCNAFGADYVILACMTSHFFIEELQHGSRAQIIDGIFETASFVARTMPQTRRVGLLASTGLLQCGLFQEAFRRFEIESIVFDAEEQKHYFMDPIYEPWGIKAGHTTGKPKDRFLSAVGRYGDLGADAVIGGCSEIPLVLAEGEAELPVINSIDCLCRAAIDRCLATTPAVGTGA